MNPDAAHIVYASSDSFAEVLGVSLASLYANSRDMETLTVYVLDHGISEANRAKLESIPEAYKRDPIRWIPAKNITEVLGMDVRTDRGNLSQYPLEEYLDNALSKSHDAKAGTLAEDLQAAEVKKREKYSHVLMQASNRGAKDQARDAHYAKIHAEAIRASGAKPAMILTWTQKRKGSPEFGLVQDAVTRIANDNKMMVIPVGIAVERAIKEMPEVKFIMPDNTHPTAAGSYLMSSVIYASLYKRDPSDAVGFAGGCEKPLDPALREKLHAF